MREFELPLVNALVGLRTHDKTNRLDPQLLECYNLKPGPRGLEEFEPATIPEDFDISVGEVETNWPFPWMFLGKVRKVLVDRTGGQDKLYLVNPDWSLTSAGVDVSSPSDGWLWDAADFGDYILLTNGTNMWYYDILTSAWLSSTGSSTLPLMGTVCNFRGQAVGGNIRGNWPQGHGDANFQCDGRYAVWSDIGSINFDTDRKNEAGFMPMPTRGEVLRVLPLRSMVVVYCTDGIFGLIPHTKPAATFGLVELWDTGVPTKCAVAGNPFQHVFIDQEGNLNRLIDGKGVDRLGYREFFRDFVPAQTRVSFLPQRGEFYFSDKEKSYVLTQHGLAKTFQRFTSVGWELDTFIGLFSEDSDQGWHITIDTFDMGMRAIKSLESLEVGLETSGDAYVTPYYGFKKAGGVTAGPKTLLNNEGVGHPGISAVDFRVKIEGDDYIGTKLDWLNARWKLSDKRNVRGMYRARKAVS